MKRFLVLALFLGSLGVMPRAALAQSRPLTTEDPETVPAGNILLEAGVDYAHDIVYPLSGLRGNLWRIGTFGLSFGVGTIAEIQLDGGLQDRLTITALEGGPLDRFLDFAPPTTTAVIDASIGAKVRFLSETPNRPAMAVRFWTRLPNAGNESGLGSDTTDFHFNVAIGKTVQSIRIVANVGLGILPDAVRGDRQNDVLDYGISVARALAPGVEVVGELNGRQNTRTGTPPPGTDSRAMMRVGTRLTRGPVRIDGALAIGVTERDPTWGFTGGVTWVFKAFNVQ